jgi:negative regulator of flagellin synthesis FlgM
MRVTGNESSSSKQTGRAGNAQEAKKADKADKASTKEVDKKSTSSVKAEISPKSREMAHAMTVVADTPDVRESKVADLKNKIANGTYRVDADAIADRMVDEHLGFPEIG